MELAEFNLMRIQLVEHERREASKTMDLQADLEVVKAGCLELSQGQLTLYTLLESLHGAALESRWACMDKAREAVSRCVEKVHAVVRGLIERLQRPLVSNDVEGKLSTCLTRARETIEAFRSSQPLPNHDPHLEFRPLGFNRPRWC